MLLNVVSIHLRSNAQIWARLQHVPEQRSANCLLAIKGYGAAQSTEGRTMGKRAEQEDWAREVRRGGCVCSDTPRPVLRRGRGLHTAKTMFPFPFLLNGI